MDVAAVLKKIDMILKTDSEESQDLVDTIESHYRRIQKSRQDSKGMVIECDFKKREIIQFFEVLTEDMLKKIF